MYDVSPFFRWTHGRRTRFIEGNHPKLTKLEEPDHTYIVNQLMFFQEVPVKQKNITKTSPTKMATKNPCNWENCWVGFPYCSLPFDVKSAGWSPQIAQGLSNKKRHCCWWPRIFEGMKWGSGDILVLLPYHWYTPRVLLNMIMFIGRNLLGQSVDLDTCQLCWRSNSVVGSKSNSSVDPSEKPLEGLMNDTFHAQSYRNMS